MSWIYILNIILTLLWGYILLYYYKQPKKKIFIIIVSFQAILISGLRGLSIGADTQTYSELFWYYCKDASWKDIANAIKNFLLGGDYNCRDMGYYICTKLFGGIIPSYRVYLFFVITVFMSGIGFFFYKYSPDLCLSYVVFDSFMFQFYGLTGIRQVLATCLVTFVGYELIRKKKLVPFLLICLFAATIHMTCIIFIPFYFVCNYNIKDRRLKYFFSFYFSYLYK